jgi:DNA-binding LacI/PurR family transcriptional regulator
MLKQMTTKTISVTIRDIATKAGISIATVSRVLNNSPVVNEDTRILVEKVMDELGYAKPSLALRRQMGTMQTIGLLLQDIYSFYYPAVIHGLESFLFRNGFNLFLCHTDGDKDLESRYIKTMQNKGTCGFILLGTRPTDVSQDHIIKLSKKTPVLMIHDYIVGSNVYSVITDEEEGAFQAVDHLASLGHKKIAYVRSSDAFSTYEYKYQGYSKALKKNGLHENPNYIVRVDPHEQGGGEAGNLLAAMQDRPTGILCASDQIAVGLMRAIQEHGFRIPRDFSVVGYSNSPIAAELYPRLTTIDQYPFRTGQTAGEMIIRIIQGEIPNQRKIILQPELIIRNSSGPAPSRG